METIDLNLLRVFVEVKQAMSFSVAAERLGVPRSTVSRAITALEQSLGTRLFHRTTRSVSASTAGEAFYDRVAPRLSELRAALQDIPEREETPSGTLRVTTTVDLGMMVLAEAVARYTLRYPHVQVEVFLSNSVTDLVRDGFDLALRIAKGRLQDSSLIAQRLGEVSLRLYASRSYLARRGTPRSSEDLRAHDCVGYRGAPELLQPGSGKKRSERVPYRISCDDMLFTRETLRYGAGVGILPSFLADNDVAAGVLEPVLPRWRNQTGTIYLVRPPSKQAPAKVAAFANLLKEILRQRPLTAKQG